MNFDDVFDAVNANGPYQITVFFFMLFSKAAAGLQMILPVLIAVHRPFYCVIDQEANRTTVPLHYPCSPNASKSLNRTCLLLYFDNSTMTSTIQSQYALHCSSNNLIHISSSIFYFGLLLGSLTIGYLSDAFGRRPSHLFCIGLMVISSLICALSPAFFLFTIMRFLVGFGTGGNLTTLFTITTEFTITRYRVYYAFNVHQGLSIGCLLLAVLGYLIRNHRDLQLTVAVLPLFLFLAIFFVDESPRWLYSRGKIRAAERVVRNIARRNGVEFEGAMRCLTALPTVFADKRMSNKIGTFSILFRSSNLRRRLMLSGTAWLIANLAYFGLYLGIDALIKGDIFMKLAVSAAVEIPARLAALFLNQRFGRRPGIFASFIGTGVFCAVSAILGTRDSLYNAQLIMSMLAKFFSAMSIESLWLFCAELFPTNVRNFSVGLTSMMSRVGALMAPLVLTTHSVFKILPFIIWSVSALLGCVLIIFLPETYRAPLEEKWSGKKKIPHEIVDDNADEVEEVHIVNPESE